MFEDALMESGHRIKTKSKWWSIVALIINCAVVLGLILYPLMHLESLPPTNQGVAGMEGMGSGGAIGGILGGMGSAPAPVVKAAPPKKIAISSGVMTGLKTAGTNPTYPPIARAARISGTVVLQATISKTGTIENLRVISGPPMLTQSALEAVKTWRYKPYQLNGEPVEVETTVNVVFNLGG
jgi:protein TonB